MKKLVLAATAATLITTPAQAETFTYEIQFSEPQFVGGMGKEGRDGRSGTTSGPFVSTASSGETVSGTVNCVGMDQPDNGLFDVHLSCTATRTDGTKSSLIYGCNNMGENKGLGCVGGIEGRSGVLQGRRGSMTLHFKEGTSVGTGQWYE